MALAAMAIEDREDIDVFLIIEILKDYKVVLVGFLDP